MNSNLSHFAINAHDVATSRVFYEAVFGWTFRPWGPPGFFQIQTGSDDEPGVLGAIQQRRALPGDVAMPGIECTFAVEDVDATARAIVEAGGTIVMERFTISGVGHLIFFADPSGNPVGAMQYDANAE